jgi:hypothetical protein
MVLLVFVILLAQFLGILASFGGVTKKSRIYLPPDKLL